MTTISDVARRAGVSAMTVSRVINGSGHTSPDARARVEQAIAELGYVPNAVARHLRSKRSKTIGLVITDITNPFFTSIARGAEDVAGPHGFGVLFCNTDESEADEVAYVSMLLQRQIDGVLLVPASASSRSIKLLRDRHVPVVVLDRRVRAPSVDVVRGDSEGGAYGLVRHLVSLGHRRIAALAGPREVSTSIDRVEGYQRALADVGVPLDPDLVRFGGYQEAAGHAMAREVLAHAQPPTAIFAGNNFIAAGVLAAVRECGLRVPDDISLVAFDDLPSAWTADPFLTVAVQPAYELGRRAAELLLERLHGGEARPAREVVLPVELLVRRSSGPPQHGLAA
ncbi:MAG TPA: LacI family DNA-binding transcriptional regulator [Candidatus Limnocylindrales bacterium]|nr:LacI family DNA-binding transcriptional regulator [Candidatus Limnocylindrales bacterium]